MKFSKIHILLIVIVLAAVVLFTRKSGFAPVQTNLGSTFKSVLDSKCDASCTPGSADANGKVMSSYYTPGLSPCGICGDQSTVNEMMNYQLVGDDVALGD